MFIFHFRQIIQEAATNISSTEQQGWWVAQTINISIVSIGSHANMLQAASRCWLPVHSRIASILKRHYSSIMFSRHTMYIHRGGSSGGCFQMWPRVLPTFKWKKHGSVICNDHWLTNQKQPRLENLVTTNFYKNSNSWPFRADLAVTRMTARTAPKGHNNKEIIASKLGIYNILSIIFALAHYTTVFIYTFQYCDSYSY